MTTISEIFNSLDPLKGASVKYKNYLELYEEKFKSLKDKPIKILEIGIEKGGSLSLWQQYFTHPESKIVGLDIAPGCKQRERDNISVVIGDQKDKETLKKVAELGPFDIIIDDGGHHTNEHDASFFYLFIEALKPDGMYFVEDLHTCYMPEFTTKDNRTFMDLVCLLLHLATVGHAGTIFDYLIQSVECYNSLTLIKKTYKHREKVTSPDFDAVAYPQK